jgi:hypothetical protein
MRLGRPPSSDHLAISIYYYSVVPNESGGQTSRSHITKQPLQQPPAWGGRTEGTSAFGAHKDPEPSFDAEAACVDGGRPTPRQQALFQKRSQASASAKLGTWSKRHASCLDDCCVDRASGRREASLRAGAGARALFVEGKRPG